MASRTTTRVMVAAALAGAVAYFAPEVVDEVGTFLGDAVGANDAVTLGEGDAALLVAANAKAKLAWESGHPAMLTMNPSRAGTQPRNRAGARSVNGAH